MSASGELLELRLLLEELCCDLCRYQHSRDHDENPGEVEIHREVAVGDRGFADIFVKPKLSRSYFVEVKFGYASDDIIASLKRKFSELPPGRFEAACKVVLVLDTADRPESERLFESLKRLLHPGLALEVWDESVFCGLVERHFGVPIPRIAPEHLIDVRMAVDQAKGEYAFGREADGTYVHDALKSQLLWHFGPWRLRQLREKKSLGVRQILEPGEYHGVAILIADLCSFSSYVRDTTRPEIIRQNLTAFYSKARYEILNHGGMLDQFIGDEVIGLFGIPDRAPGYVESALAAAEVLAGVGRSVSQEWQKQIDRLQPKAGIHAGLALGDLHVLPLRPFGRTHCGFIGDSINIAARLMSEGGEDEIVVANSFYQQLPETSRRKFTSLEPVDARNVGRIRAWKSRVEL